MQLNKIYRQTREPQINSSSKFMTGPDGKQKASYYENGPNLSFKTMMPKINLCYSSNRKRQGTTC
uniref:Uncharacterized protein n=1 Tax=Rhizophora mucronata TaxID=61149 RepID=A0A2P2N0N5_RHIMU